MMTNTPRYKSADGRVFTGLFALDTETELCADRSPHIPRLALASVSDGDKSFLIHPDDVAAFVLAHDRGEIVFHNAAFDFWVIDAHLRRWHAKTMMIPLTGTRKDMATQMLISRSADAIVAWTAHLRDGRFHDTMLLDMLVRLAFGRQKAPDVVARDLGKLAAEYAGMTLDKNDPYRLRFGELIDADWDKADPGFFAYAVPDAIATARSYIRLRERGLELMRKYRKPLPQGRFDIDPQAVEKFGVLSERIQVGAAIALASMTRLGLTTDPKRLAVTEHNYKGRMAEIAKRLDNEYPGLFTRKKKTGELNRTKSGAPRKSHKVLDCCLLQAVADIQHATTDLVAVPRTPKGKVAHALDAWEELIGRHAFIRLWADYEKTSKLCQFLANFAQPIIRPRYQTFVRTGRTSSSGPNMQQVPREDEFREIIVPAPGFVLLAVDYSFIELVTLAACCQARFGFSKLGDAIKAGIDPHAYTAAMLSGRSYEEFVSLKQSDPKHFKQWRQSAKAVNFGVPGCLGAASLVQSAHKSYGVAMTLEQAQEFRDRLCQQIYPELDLFLMDHSVQTLASNLRAGTMEMRTVFPGEDAARIMAAVRHIVAGNPFKKDGTPYNEAWVEKIWCDLLKVCHNPALVPAITHRLGSKELEDQLFFASVANLTGRIRAGVPKPQECNTQFQGLAADGAKLAFTALMLAGYRVVGFIHDEVLIELPDEGGYVSKSKVDAVCEIMVREMERVTYGMPVGVEATVATCWSKRAKLLVDGDKIRAWTSPPLPDLPAAARPVAREEVFA